MKPTYIERILLTFPVVAVICTAGILWYQHQQWERVLDEWKARRERSFQNVVTNHGPGLGSSSLLIEPTKGDKIFDDGLTTTTNEKPR